MDKYNPITRNITDVKLMSKVALPAAGKSEETGVIDLTQKGGIDPAFVHLIIPALPNLAATKKVIIKLQSSADGKTWADVDTAPVVTITGAESGGSAESHSQFRIPPGAERYIKAVATADASSGNVTAQEFELSIRV